MSAVVSSGSHDAASSPGWSADKLTGARLDKMKACAEIASLTFPPPFENKPQEGPVETPEGDMALEKGRWAMKRRSKAPKDSGSTGTLGPGFPAMEELDKELGGVDGLFTLFGLHYVRMFANPRMRVLFDTRGKGEAEHSALDHGKRIAATLLDEVFGTRYYASLGRGPSGAWTVMGTHKKAKKCPMRPVSQQVSLPENHPRGDRRFTVNQRDTWVGGIMCAANDCGASEAFEQKLGLWLAMSVSAYAPFVDEETGELDWMEESSYG